MSPDGGEAVISEGQHDYRIAELAADASRRRHFDAPDRELAFA